MVRFYGISPIELDKLDSETYYTLWKAIDVLEAQETFNGLKVAMVPNYQANKIKEELDKAYRKAYPRDIYKPQTITLDEYMKSAKGGIGG